jgi:hypothetical protein
MTGSRIVDVALGLSLLYLLLSLACSAVQEIIAGALGLRQAALERGIEQMLNSKALRQALYAHPLIQSLHHGALERTRRPSYIASDVFAAALLDVMRSGQVAAAELGGAERALAALLTGTRLGGQIDREWARAGDWVEKEREALGRWFDQCMERLSGSYKRAAQIVLLVVAAVVTLAVDADSALIARTLWSDRELRTAVVERAASFVAAGAPAPASPAGLDQALQQVNGGLRAVTEELDALKLPVGWPASGWLRPGESAARKVLGLVLTVLAVSLGAPFWFDTLGRLANLRSAGVRPASAATGAEG